MVDFKEEYLSESYPPPDLPSTEGAIDNEIRPPKDGKQGWCVVMGAFCATLCTLGATTSFGVFQAYYGSELLADQSPSSIAWVGGLQYFFLFALGLPTTFLQDMGYTRLMVYTGTLLVVTAQLGISWCDKYHQLIIVQGVIFGIGSGMLMSTASTTVPHWFERHVAMGIIATGSAVGGTLCSALASTLLPLIGFAWSARVFALLFLCLLSISCLLIKPYPAIRCPTRKTLTWKLLPVRQPAYLVYVVSASLAGAGVYLPVNYMEEYSQRLHLEGNSLSYLAAIINASSIPGRLLGGYLADSISPHLVLAPSVLTCGVLCFVWTSCTETGAILAFTACFGLSMGVYVALLPSGVAVIRPDDMTLSVGLLFSIISLPSLCSPPIFGALISTKAGSASYANAAIFGGCILMTSSVGILFTWWLNRPRQPV